MFMAINGVNGQKIRFTSLKNQLEIMANMYELASGHFFSPACLKRFLQVTFLHSPPLTPYMYTSDA